ncbi:hypothetical protein G4926_12040 [Anaerostipes hadrus]|jgi:hypothetical protein|uniref:hypothetical protein n=1 Tax=Anaerostipes hadrus TaxID=649756 RepID=UPI0002A2D138|nr:hypothetical protein [Anaerostipes hadrus]EKY24918.1 hypothetical protein HMPREF0369_00325 [Anaerostipes hadrus ATCC 29173 = JCM 17467]NSG77218.1 hypothetical protein [Anaerostipes hadrus]RHO51606.1 hypothetical protein DW127_03575 [Lachnospiraceae bacterium AM10-38]BEG59059.1 hypothetical protein Ahadr17467_06890 [Anaerostipes hadrus ATCC 29173 = JCM 17467]
MSFEIDINYKSYIKGMDDYIKEFEKLKKENPQEAKIRAKESLIESGVLDEEGNPKKQICD